MYKITRQYQRGGESLLKEFIDLLKAKEFIHTCIEEDQRMRVHVVYRLYDIYGDVLNTFDSEETTGTASGGGAASASSSAGKGSGFNPTPFNMSPRPAGMPHNWLTEPPEDGSQTK